MEKEETKKLAIKLRQLREEQVYLDKNIRTLHLREEKIMDDIEGLKESKIKIIESHRVQEGKLSTVSGEVRAEEIKLRNVKKVIDTEKDSLVLTQDRLLEEGKKISKAIEKIKNDGDRLKTQKSIYEKGKRDLDDEKAVINNEKKVILEQSAELKNKEEDYDSKVQKLETYKDEIYTTNINKLKELKETLEKKKEEQEKEKADIDIVTKEIGDKQKTLKEDGYRLDKLLDETMDAKLSLKQKEKAMNRIADDLTIREKEAQITELRVKKIIRDNNISKELKKLEKELNA